MAQIEMVTFSGENLVPEPTSKNETPPRVRSGTTPVRIGASDAATLRHPPLSAPRHAAGLRHAPLHHGLPVSTMIEDHRHQPQHHDHQGLPRLCPHSKEKSPEMIKL